MKIKEIVIKDFGGIKERRIIPDRINALVGHIGTGKSSTFSAIRYVLTGDCEQSDIRKGANEASVTLTFDDGSTIQRTRNMDGNVVRCNGKRATAKATSAFLKEKLGFDISVFKAMMGTDFFAELGQKDITAFFLSILPVRINFETICQMASKRLGRRLLHGEGERLALQFLDRNLTDTELSVFPINYPQDDTAFTLADLDAAYKSFFEQRRAVASEVKILKARAEFKGSLPKQTKESLEKSLFDVAKQEADASTHKKRVDAYDRAVKEKERVLKRKAELEEQLKAYSDVKAPDETQKTKAQEDKAKFQRAITKSQGILGTLDSNLKMFQRTLENLDKPVCPISKKLVCTTDKTAIRDEMKQGVANNEKAAAEHREFIKRCEEQIAQRDAAIENYNKNSLRWTQKQSLEQQLKNLIIPELPEKPEEAIVQDFAAQKRSINEQLSIYAAYETAEKDKSALAVKKRELAELEACASIMDVKTGIRSLILKRALKPFEDVCNKKADLLRDGFRLQFRCEEGIEILVSPRKGDEFISYKRVSNGEFIFVAYLLMTVVNAICDTRILLIDNLDKLDADALKGFVSLLKLDTEYDTVLFGTVDHDDTVRILQEAGVNIL